MANYGGENLARKGVVYVTVAYRVGALGFMAHPGAHRGVRSRTASGNYGHLDQVAALQWIQRNIERFGGDPKRVTIIGQSAGAELGIQPAGEPARRKDCFIGIVGMSGGRSARGRGSDPLSRRRRSPVSSCRRSLKVASLERAAQRACGSHPGRAGGVPVGRHGGHGAISPEPRCLLHAAHARGRSSPRVSRTTCRLLLGFTRDESSNDLRTAPHCCEYHGGCAAHTSASEPPSSCVSIRLASDASRCRRGSCSAGTAAWRPPCGAGRSGSCERALARLHIYVCPSAPVRAGSRVRRPQSADGWRLSHQRSARISC